MKKQPLKSNNSKEVLIVSSIVVVLAIGGFTWYYLAKKKKQKQNNAPPNDALGELEVIPVGKTPPFIADTPARTTSKPLFAGFPLKRGSRGADVKILQRYLKIYKENLGRSGKNRDGVDGIFGPLTEKAARKRLGKTSFTKSDINSMKNALKIV